MNQTHDCKIELRDADLRATPARVALLQLLEQSGAPMDVTTMIKNLTQEGLVVDQATVFRIINTFTEKGITKQLSLREGKFRYELSSKEEHHHLICEQCGSIEDISDCNITALEKDIKKKKKFLVRSHALEFFGVCQQCQH